MISVSTATKNHYIQDENLHKELRIDFTPKNGTTASVLNNQIVTETFDLEQNLCDGEVDFVGCVSSSCRFTLWNVFGSYDVGTKVEVYITADNCEEIKVFTGYVNEVNANFLDGEVEYDCYDLIGYDYLSNWKFGDTLASELESDSMNIGNIFELMEQRSYQYNLDIVYDTLPNNITIYSDMADTFKGMSALDILKYICQTEGLFGVINNEGQFELRQINNNSNLIGAYPSGDTYPSEELYPGIQNEGEEDEYILLPYETFESSSRLTKREPPVNGVLIMETEEQNADKSADNRQDVKNYTDSGLDDPNGTPFSGSVIKIVGNPFIHDKGSSAKLAIANNIQSVAGGYTYYPFTAKTKGIPFIEVGDYVDFIVTDWNEQGEEHHKQVTCLILSRTLHGIQHMTDTYSAKIVDDWKSEERIHYICALGGASNVADDISDEITEDIVDDKMEEHSNVWSVVSCDFPPSYPEAQTIYFIRGIVTMENDYDDGGATNTNTEPEEPVINPGEEVNNEG